MAMVSNERVDPSSSTGHSSTASTVGPRATRFVRRSSGLGASVGRIWRLAGKSSAFSARPPPRYCADFSSSAACASLLAPGRSLVMTFTVREGSRLETLTSTVTRYGVSGSIPSRTTAPAVDREPRLDAAFTATTRAASYRSLSRFVSPRAASNMTAEGHARHGWSHSHPSASPSTRVGGSGSDGHEAAPATFMPDASRRLA